MSLRQVTNMRESRVTISPGPVFDSEILYCRTPTDMGSVHISGVKKQHLDPITVTPEESD